MAFTRSAGATLHVNLTDVTATQHHAAGLADHDIAEHDDTGATGAELDTLTDGSNSDALHAHTTDPAQATAAAVEARTNEDTYVPPDLIVRNPGVSKCWVHYGMVSTSSIQASFNVTSITDDGVGITTITIGVNFTLADHAVVASDSGTDGTLSLAPPTATVQQISNFDGTPAAVDRADVCVAMFGDQS